MRLVHLVTGADGQSHVSEENLELDAWTSSNRRVVWAA